MFSRFARDYLGTADEIEVIARARDLISGRLEVRSSLHEIEGWL